VQIGVCAEELREELPQLCLHFMHVHLGGKRPFGPAGRSLTERLLLLSDRFLGARAVGIRAEPVPSAYRAFYHQVGLDPELVPTPLELAVRERLLAGRFASEGLLSDALLVALLETGVPIFALDRDTLFGSLRLRLARASEPLGSEAEASPLSGGEIVVADGRFALALIFSAPAPAHRVKPKSSSVTLYALQVHGVPCPTVEEAMSICRSGLLERG
jgi:DNA/RNA-binding domain of Phe-tRNA-synthetase-like protein